MKRARSSEVWTYFDVESEAEKSASCTICKTKLSFKTTVSNLKKHLKTKHLGIIPTDARQSTVEAQTARTGQAQIREATISNGAVPSSSTETQPQPLFSSAGPSLPSSSVQTQSTVSSALPLAPVPTLPARELQATMSRYLPKKLTPAQRKEIDDKLLGLFYFDFQPFTIVEDKGFRGYSKAMNPAYSLPTRSHASKTMLTAKYLMCYNEVKERLEKGVKSVCLTTDCWSSSAQDSYMAVTAHYFDSDYNLQTVLLECANFLGSHTTDNLAAELKRVIDEWNLSKSVALIVADNAKNIQNAIRDLNFKQFGCFAHTINLTARTALEIQEVKDILEPIKKIVTYFKHSNQATEKLLKYQLQNEVAQPKRVKQDVSTRWNSTYFMLERFVALEDALRSTIGLLDKDLPVLSPEEWKFCRDLCMVLRPLYEVTNEMSGESYVTGSLVIVYTRSLINMYKNKIPAKAQSYHPTILDVVKRIETGLTSRMANIEYSGTFSVCTFMDPRYKMHFFREATAAECAKKKVTELATAVITKRTASVPQSSTTAPQRNMEEHFSVLDDINDIISEIQPITSPHAVAIAEVQRYLNDQMLPRSGNPNQWWNNHKFVYPTLSEIYLTHCCILATSVPCERMFSKTGQIISDRRTRLTCRKVKQIMFLNINSK